MPASMPSKLGDLPRVCVTMVGVEKFALIPGLSSLAADMPWPIERGRWLGLLLYGDNDNDGNNNNNNKIMCVTFRRT